MNVSTVRALGMFFFFNVPHVLQGSKIRRDKKWRYEKRSSVERGNSVFPSDTFCLIRLKVVIRKISERIEFDKWMCEYTEALKSVYAVCVVDKYIGHYHPAWGASTYASYHLLYSVHCTDWCLRNTGRHYIYLLLHAPYRLAWHNHNMRDENNIEYVYVHEYIQMLCGLLVYKCMIHVFPSVNRTARKRKSMQT